MKKSFLAIVLYVFACVYSPSLQAQLIHFSQFNNQPLFLNPALTGIEAGEYRAALTYRNQWQSIPASYSTLIASFDRSLGTCANEDSYLGIGGVIYHDNTGDGILKKNSAAISLAYHRKMDKVLKVSFGGQMGYTNKKIDFSKLTFPGNIIDFEISPGFPSGDFMVLEDNFNYFNTKLGILNTISLGELSQLEFGGSYSHTFKSSQNSLPSIHEANRPTDLWIAHIGARLGVSERISINPSFLHMKRSSNQLNMAGASMDYYFNGNQETSNSLSVGSWYRFDDAVIFSLGANIGRITANVSYDLTVSDLRQANDGQGALEVSVIYRGLTKACN